MNSFNSNKYVTSHNFNSMNKAIDIEVEKRNELSRLYTSQKNMNRSTMYLYICASLCLLIITASLVYWLFFIETKNQEQNFKANTDNSASLKKIAKNDKSIKESINTSFTVFQRTQIETGEYVVTGKNFSPKDLITPEDQYCYIEPMTADYGLAGEPVARMVKKDLSIETTNEFLIKNALPHCQFSK